MGRQCIGSVLCGLNKGKERFRRILVPDVADRLDPLAADSAEIRTGGAGNLGQESQAPGARL